MTIGVTAVFPTFPATESFRSKGSPQGTLNFAPPVTEELVDSTLADVLAQMDTHTAEQLADRLHMVGEMLSSLAERHIRRGENARAEVLYLRAIQVFRGVLRSDHPLIAMARDNLAGLYKARRQYALAESLQRTALADLQQYYGQPHADIAITMCNLADTCMLTGRSEDARALLTTGITMFRKLYGTDDKRVIELISHFEEELNRFNQTMTHSLTAAV